MLIINAVIQFNAKRRRKMMKICLRLLAMCSTIKLRYTDTKKRLRSYRVSIGHKIATSFPIMREINYCNFKFSLFGDFGERFRLEGTSMICITTLASLFFLSEGSECERSSVELCCNKILDRIYQSVTF